MENHMSARVLWPTGEKPLETGPLEQHERADVCIVGAGIAGVSTAYLLARQGQSVVLLDDGPVGGGDTCRTTAHLSNAIDDRYFLLEQYHGEQGARLAADSHTAAIERIGEIVNELGIDCAYERLEGYLLAAPGKDQEVLDRELDATHRAGLTDVTKLPRAPITALDTGPCLRFPRQAQFHPLHYLNALALRLIELGGRIYTGTHVSRVRGGARAQIETDTGKGVRADHIVVATNSPINDQFVIHTKQAPYRTFAIAARVPENAVSPGLYWDTLDPYHYVRLHQVPGEWDPLESTCRHASLSIL